MNQDKTELTNLLTDLGLEYGKCTVNEILSHCESYVPCAAKRELEAAESTKRKNLQNLTELQIEDSRVRTSILSGLHNSGKYTNPKTLTTRLT